MSLFEFQHSIDLNISWQRVAIIPNGYSRRSGLSIQKPKVDGGRGSHQLTGGLIRTHEPNRKIEEYTD